MTKRKSAGFTVIDWARNQGVGSSSERHLLLLLATYADAQGRCHPSVTTLAKQIGVGSRRVRQLELALAKQGLLRREQTKRSDGRFSVNAYELVMNGQRVASDGRSMPTRNGRQPSTGPAAALGRVRRKRIALQELPRELPERQLKKSQKRRLRLKSDRAISSPTPSSPPKARETRRKSQARAARTAKEARRQSLAVEQSSAVGRTEFDVLAARFGAHKADQIMKGRK